MALGCVNTEVKIIVFFTQPGTHLLAARPAHHPISPRLSNPAEIARDARGESDSVPQDRRGQGHRGVAGCHNQGKALQSNVFLTLHVFNHKL